MYHRKLVDARKGQKPGLLMHVLMQKGDVPDASVAIAWMEVEPGGSQNPHCHAQAQAYIIMKGTGRALVGDEEVDVEPEEIIYAPPNVVHGIRNTGDQTLAYISITTPADDLLSLYPVPD